MLWGGGEVRICIKEVEGGGSVQWEVRVGVVLRRGIQCVWM